MKKRLLFTYMAIMIVTLFASQISFWINGQDFLEQQSVKQYESQTKLIRDIFEERDISDEKECDQFAKEYAKEQEVRITIIDSFGKVVGESDHDSSTMENHGDRQEVQNAASGKTALVIRHSNTLGMDYCYCALPLETDDFRGVIRISVPMKELQTLKMEYFKSSFLILSIGVLFVTALVFAFTRFVATPIDDVIEASQKIAEGTLNTRIHMKNEKPTSQVEKLAYAFNVMSEKLEITMDDLKKRNNELEAILKSMNSAVLAINGKNEILFYNDAFLNIIDHRGDFLGESVYSLIRSTLIFDVIDKVRESRELYCDEGSVGIGKEKFIRVTGTVLNQEKKNSGSMLLIIEDITEVKKLENMRSDFVSNVTHELKTPLTSIRGFVDTLKQGAIQNEAYARRFLDIIDIEAERLYTLIQDILLLAEIEAGNDYNIQECNPNDIIEETIELLKKKADDKGNIELIFHPEPYIRPFSCNPDRMKQLLINLVDNGIKNTEQGSVTVRCKVWNNHLMISVKDTGIGIEKEHLSRIFERFYRVDKGRSRKMGGTGLGLSIVKHIIEMYNGDIFINSEVNQGTEFIIKLPYDK